MWMTTLLIKVQNELTCYGTHSVAATADACWTKGGYQTYTQSRFIIIKLSQPSDALRTLVPEPTSVSIKALNCTSKKYFISGASYCITGVIYTYRCADRESVIPQRLFY